MALDLTSLNPAQREAVETVDGPLLVLAGAGSGKTRVLTFRIAHLVGDLRVSPAEILAITFTNKAAAEMRERLGALVGPSVRSMWVLTFHAMCVRMLRADGDRLGFTRNFTIYDQDDSKRLLKEVMRELEIDDKHYPVNGVANRISSAKNELLIGERLRGQGRRADGQEGRPDHGALPGAAAGGQRDGLRRPARQRAPAAEPATRTCGAPTSSGSATSASTSTRTPTTRSTRSPTCSRAGTAT